MDRKTIELAKKNYKQRTGINDRLYVRPIKIKGTDIISENFVTLNGKRVAVIKSSDGKIDFDC